MGRTQRNSTLSTSINSAAAASAEKGHAAKAGVEVAPRIVREFKLSEGDEYELGQAITVEVFEIGDSVKVTGTSKGKGFQGVVKRYGFAGRRASHGSG